MTAKVKNLTYNADQPVLSQLGKFKAAAASIGTDDDPERFKERVKRIGGVKPDAPEPLTPKRDRQCSEG